MQTFISHHYEKKSVMKRKNSIASFPVKFHWNVIWLHTKDSRLLTAPKRCSEHNDRCFSRANCKLLCDASSPKELSTATEIKTLFLEFQKPIIFFYSWEIQNFSTNISFKYFWKFIVWYNGDCCSTGLFNKHEQNNRKIHNHLVLLSTKCRTKLA